MTDVTVRGPHRTGLIYRMIPAGAIVPIIVRPDMTHFANTIVQRSSRNIGPEYGSFGTTIRRPFDFVSDEDEISRGRAIHPVQAGIMTDTAIIHMVIFSVNNSSRKNNHHHSYYEDPDQLQRLHEFLLRTFSLVPGALRHLRQALVSF